MISHRDRPYDINIKLNDLKELTDIYRPVKTQKPTPKVDYDWNNRPQRFSEADLDQMSEHGGSECEY